MAWLVAGTEEALKQVHQRRALIFFWQIVRMNEFVAEPRKSLRIEGVDQPVDHSTNARDPHRVRMIGQPDVEWEIYDCVGRDDACGNRVYVGWQPADSSPFGDRPEVGAADIGSHRDKSLVWHSGKQLVVELLCVG